jgi:Flp pilus assembly protein TadD
LARQVRRDPESVLAGPLAPPGADATLRRAKTLCSEGHDREAREAIEAIPNASGSERAHLLGLLQVHCRDYAAALASFSKAVELNPRHAGALFNRGIVRAVQGDYTQARQDRERAIALEPALAAKRAGGN